MKTNQSGVFGWWRGRVSAVFLLLAWSCVLLGEVRAQRSITPYGNGSLANSGQYQGFDEVRSISSKSGFFALGLDGSGEVLYWGTDTWGNSVVPSVSGMPRAVRAGYFHSGLIDEAGGVILWGYDLYSSLSQPPGGGAFKDLSLGVWSNLALTEGGTVVAWGNDSHGQSTVPPGLADVVSVSAGMQHSLALKADGTVVAWGDDTDGQSTVPPGLSGVVQIEAGDMHSLALQSDGTVVAWGRNSSGECDVPGGLGTVSEIAAGGAISCARLNTGQFWQWGGSIGISRNFAQSANVVEIDAGSGFLATIRDTSIYTVTFDLGEHVEYLPGQGALEQMVSAGGRAFVPKIEVESGWRFEGWDQEFGNIGSDLTVRPVLVRSHRVTFSTSSMGRITNGSIVALVDAGGDVVAPTVVANQYWEFIGWSGSLTDIQADAELIAQYRPWPTVEFRPGAHGVFLSGTLDFWTQQILPGTSPNVPGIRADQGWTYVGWDNGLTIHTLVYDDVVVTALYERWPEVVFDEGDHGSVVEGEVLQSVAPGGEAESPVIEPEIGWRFLGWDAEYSNVTEDLVVRARYERMPLVVFDAGTNGAVISGLSQQYVVLGSAATAPQVQGDEEWHFVGWNAGFESVVDDLVVTAVYERKPLVEFRAGSHGVFGPEASTRQYVVVGTAATAPVVVDLEEGWIFDGWDVPFDSVAGDLVVTARYRYVVPWMRLSQKAVAVDLPGLVTVALQLTDQTGRGVPVPMEAVERAGFFEYRENGVVLSEEDSLPRVSRFEMSSGRVPTVLMLDNGFSSAPMLDQIKAAVRSMVSNRVPGQEFAIYSYSSTPRLLQDFTADEGLLINAIDRMGIGSPSTNLHGAVIEGLDLDGWSDRFARGDVSRGYMVVLTDDADSVGQRSPSEVLAVRGDRRIFTVGLGDGPDGARLGQLGNSGYFPIDSVDELDAALMGVQNEISHDLSSFYWVNYRSAQRGDTGHVLDLSIDGNPNIGAGSVLTVNFNSDGFADEEPGVMVNRSAFAPLGVGEIVVGGGGGTLLRVDTIRGVAPPQYVWEPLGTDVVSVHDFGGGHVRLDPIAPGSVDLRVTDVANAGVAPGVFHQILTVHVADGVIGYRRFDAALTAAGLVGVNATAEADPNGDGIANGVAFALGLPLVGGLDRSEMQRLPVVGKSDDGSRLVVRFARPSDAPDDVIYVVEGLSSFSGTGWTELARKSDDGPWTGVGSVTEGAVADGFVPVTVENTVGFGDVSTGFMRLRVEIGE